MILQADKLQTLLKAAKVDEVEPIWTSLFAKVHMFPMMGVDFLSMGMVN
jgi:hypothetical protein